LLVCFGLSEIYSVALGQGATDLLNFKKQVFFIVIGFVLFFTVAFIDYNFFRSFSIYFYIIGATLLVLVLIFGITINGTKGWFNFGGVVFQPVEFIKFVVVLFLAKYFSDSSFKISPLRHLVVSGGGVFLLFVLVLMQPDFGSGLLLFSVWLAMIVIAGFKKRYLAALFLAITIIGAGSWMFYLKPYQKQRVMTFFDPSFDPLNQGYNVAQAIIAVGSGRLLGRGIGFGSQSQLKFLPESQNDFIFAVISEELGFLGIASVLTFFSILFFRSMLSIKRVKDDFGIFFILGAMSLIFIEMFINIGMNMGLLPVVGIPLPLVSYGGSAMISNLIMLGVVQSIILRSRIR
ncbi:MAG: rod shape-determining protein RodA, partial [Patescibacteria group bacterium]